MRITELQFFEMVGRWPKEFDMIKANCPHVGTVGHRTCGICKEHNMPRFVCKCLAKTHHCEHNRRKPE